MKNFALAYVPLTNIALGKKAYQSSTDYDGEASRAIDGNPDSNYFVTHTCTHTKSGAEEWWEVDLIDAATISQVSQDIVYFDYEIIYAIFMLYMPRSFHILTRTCIYESLHVL